MKMTPEQLREHNTNGGITAIITIIGGVLIAAAIAAGGEAKRKAYLNSPEGMAEYYAQPITYKLGNYSVYKPQYKGAHDCTTHKPSPDGAMIYVDCSQ